MSMRLVVGDASSADDLPQCVLNAVEQERLIQGQIRTPWS